MKPLPFKDQNTEIAKNQPQYLTLPAHVTQDGMVLSCWGMTWGERIRVLFTGRVWLSMMTFHTPLQPVKLTAFNPLDLARAIAKRLKAKTPEDGPSSTI